MTLVSPNDPNKDFVTRANPHAWFMTAYNLDITAEVLWKGFGSSITSVLGPDSEVIMTRDDHNKSVFLLAGFAIENFIKAYLVFENPHWISNGVLAKDLKSHSLCDLADRSSLIPMKIKGRATLQRLEGGLESWARYPCALSEAESFDEDVMTTLLWNNYKALVHTYTKDIRRLLSEKLWNGPHGFKAQWKFEDHR